MQPLQYDLRCPAAKDNSIMHAAAARSNLDAATTMRSAETELQNPKELRATASEIAAPKPDLDAKAKKKTILKHFLKGFCEGKSLAPKWKKSADKSLWQPSCSHSNTIYDVQLQKRIVLRMQPRCQATLHDAAITMRFAASRRKPARIYAVATSDDDNHAAIPMRSATTDSRNAKNYAHRNNHSLQNTEEEPKQPQPQPPHTRGTFHRRPKPPYTEKHKVSCSGFLPKT